MRERVAALLLAASSAAFAGGRWKFDDLVKAIETQYGVKHTKIPLLGVANFFVKVARFSDGGLRPLVRTHSRESGEDTYVYTGEEGKSTKMLVATLERNEATLIEVTVKMETLIQMLESPEGIGKSFGVKEDRDRDWE